MWKEWIKTKNYWEEIKLIKIKWNVLAIDKLIVQRIEIMIYAFFFFWFYFLR